jgi:hypothetical protein
LFVNLFAFFVIFHLAATERRQVSPERTGGRGIESVSCMGPGFLACCWRGC